MVWGLRIGEKLARTARHRGRLAVLLVSLLGVGSAVALIVTLPIYAGTTARWLAFALGCEVAGASLLALTIHEITSERVRHELEIA